MCFPVSRFLSILLRTQFREPFLLEAYVLYFPGGTDGKESASEAGDLGWIPELGRSPREGNGNPLQYSCLENSMDRGAWYTIVYGVAESGTTE